MRVSRSSSAPGDRLHICFRPVYVSIWSATGGPGERTIPREARVPAADAPKAGVPAMVRRRDPKRMEQARRSATRDRLMHSGMSAERTDSLIAASEAQADGEGRRAIPLRRPALTMKQGAPDWQKSGRECSGAGPRQDYWLVATLRAARHLWHGPPGRTTGDLNAQTPTATLGVPP